MDTRLTYVIQGTGVYYSAEPHWVPVEAVDFIVVRGFSVRMACIATGD